MPPLRSVKVGSQACVTLKLNKTAKGDANFFVATSDFNGAPMGGGVRIVTPGTHETICVTPGSPGILEVKVDCHSQTDGGSLELTENGLPKDTAKVKGDDDWSSAVIA